MINANLSFSVQPYSADFLSSLRIALDGNDDDDYYDLPNPPNEPHAANLKPEPFAVVCKTDNHEVVGYATISTFVAKKEASLRRLLGPGVGANETVAFLQVFTTKHSERQGIAKPLVELALADFERRNGGLVKHVLLDRALVEFLPKSSGLRPVFAAKSPSIKATVASKYRGRAYEGPGMTANIEYKIIPYNATALRQSRLYIRGNERRERGDSMTLMALQGQLAVKNPLRLAVAFFNHLPIGWASISTFVVGEEPILDFFVRSELNGRMIGWANAFVAAEWRRKGVGEKLLKMAVAEFSSRNPEIDTLLLDSRLKRMFPQQARLEPIFASSLKQPGFKKSLLQRYALVAS